MNLFIKSIAVLSAVLLLSACETNPNEKGGMNADGSMSGSASPGTQGELEQIGDRVLFDTDSSQLTAEAQHTLGLQAAWLKQYSNLNLTIEGHADERGTREYNLALGERRANSAKKYLAGLGVASNRLSTISYGKERPAVVGSDDSAWSREYPSSAEA